MTAETTQNRAAILVRNAAIGLAGLMGAIAFIRLVFVRSYNYDELSHAHMTWLVSIGQVPYRDFAANHFPFLWMLLSPLMWVLPHSPLALVILRSVALGFNVVFIGALYALASVELQPRERIWAAVCLGLAVFCPLSMHYLIEFRPDAIANGLIFSVLAWLRLRGSTRLPGALISGFCLGTACLVNTKYLLFLFVLAAVTLAMNARQLRRTGPFLSAIGLGFNTAMLGGVLLLVCVGVSLIEAWQMVIAYNSTVEQVRPFGFGLAGALMKHPAGLAYGVVGLAGCLILCQRQRRSPGVLMVAIGIFLVLDLFVATRPWKQYVVSWLLLAACLPARSLPPLIARLGPQAQAALAVCVLAVAGIGFARMGIVDTDGGGMTRATQDRASVWISQRVPADGFVVTSFYLHPIFRRDAFFKTVIDIIPNNPDPADGLEEFMPRLVSSSYAEHFQPAGYEQDLELHPPAAVVMNTQYSPGQDQALNDYLARHADVYQQYHIPDTPILVLLRETNRPAGDIEQKPGAERSGAL